MIRALLAGMLLSVVHAGCATVVPMQTASVVERGAWRLGAQGSAAGFCNLSDITQCHDYPDGVPTPELRLDARRGLGAKSDLGASLQLQPVVLSAERPLHLGLAVDGKRELLRISAADGNAHVVSGGLQLAGAVSGRLGLSPMLQAELALPVHYGYQTTRFEWVAGLSLSRRAVFPSVGGPPEREAMTTWRMGASVGAYRRTPSGWGAQLGYLTLVDRPRAGALLLQFGWFWDVGAGAGAPPG